MIYSIIYTSKATANFSLEEIHKMLLDAKNYNKSKKITGCILYHKNQFIQLIEGEDLLVQSLYASIQEDKRHVEIKTLIRTASEQTLWNDWSMAFYDFSEEGDQENYKRLLLESSFESAHKKVKDSEVLSVLRKHTSKLLDS